MLYASRVDFPDSTLIVVGSSFNGRIVTKIEVYHYEYEDHSEMTIIPYCGDDQLGKVWNRPCLVLYLLADKQEPRLTLVCDRCGRIEHEPYDEGDHCWDGCGRFRILADKQEPPSGMMTGGILPCDCDDGKEDSHA